MSLFKAIFSAPLKINKANKFALQQKRGGKSLLGYSLDFSINFIIWRTDIVKKTNDTSITKPIRKTLSVAKSQKTIAAIHSIGIDAKTTGIGMSILKICSQAISTNHNKMEDVKPQIKQNHIGII